MDPHASLRAKGGAVRGATWLRRSSKLGWLVGDTLALALNAGDSEAFLEPVPLLAQRSSQQTPTDT
jgi:hypothetical protein